RFDSGAHQLGGNLESALGSVGVVKRTGVGNQRGVNALSDWFGDAHPGRFAEVVDHLAHGRGSGVDPVDGTEERRGSVVVDVHHQLLLQIDQTGPRDVGALNNKHSVVRLID